MIEIKRKNIFLPCLICFIVIHFNGVQAKNAVVLGSEHAFQSLINDNKIIEIKTNYNLEGNTIILQEGSKLVFKGGSISNGCLKCNNDCEIEDGLLYDTEVDVRGVANVIIRGCEFIYKKEIVTDCAIYINNSSYIEIYNCKFLLTDSLSSIKIIESNNVDVFNCNIDGGRNIEVLNRDNGGGIFIIYSSNRVNVSNNRIKNVGIGVAIQGLGSNEERLVSDVIVHGNTINDCRCYGIIAYYGLTSCSNLIISNNIISNISGQYNNIATQPSRSLGGGIYLQQVSDVVCSGNYIRNVAISTDNNSTLAPAGIAVATSTRCKVTNNIIEDCHQQGIILRGDNNTICNNTIRYSHDIPFEFRAGHGNIIMGNHIISYENTKGPSIFCYQHGNKNSLGLSTTIGDNIIEANIIEGRQTPIYCYKVDGTLQIRDNILSNYSGTGVEVAEGNVIITGNVMNTKIKTGTGINAGEMVTGYSKDNLFLLEASPISISRSSKFIAK